MRMAFATAMVMVGLALVSAGRAAGPKAGADPAEVRRLIDSLGEDDPAARKAAEKKLLALEESAVPALRRAAKGHADVDVRLRAAVLAAAIEGKYWGPVRAFGEGAALKEAPPGLGYWLNRVGFTRDGKYALAAGGALILYDLATGKEVKRVLEVGGARPGLAMSADGKYCLTGHANDTAFHLVGVPSLKVVQTFRGHYGLGVFGVALSPDGSKAASAGYDGTLRLWDVKTGKEVRKLDGFVGAPRRVSFSPDGKELLSGHVGNSAIPTVRLWDVGSGKLLRSYKGQSNEVVAVAFLPGGKRAFSAGAGGTLLVWDLGSGKVLREMKHRGALHDAAVSPDGKRALSAGWDRTVRLWDLTTGKQVYAFNGHVTSVLGVAFSADGRRALSSDAVCCVRLWKLGK